MSQWLEIPAHRVLQLTKGEFVEGFDIVYAESGTREALTSQTLHAVYPDQIAFYLRRKDRRRFKRATHRPFEFAGDYFLEEL